MTADAEAMISLFSPAVIDRRYNDLPYGATVSRLMRSIFARWMTS
jgi:hypothetical protein